MNYEDITKSNWHPLGYAKVSHSLWRLFDLSVAGFEPSAVGAHYATKKELLAALPTYAKEFGAIPYLSVKEEKFYWCCLELYPGEYRIMSKHTTERAAVDAYRRAWKQNPHRNHRWVREDKIKSDPNLNTRTNVTDSW